MNKSDLVEKAAKEAGLAQTVTDKALGAIINTIMQAVASGDAVTLVGFGTFKATERAARVGKNPKTGESLNIPASVVPKFSAGANFKAAVSKKN